MHGQLRHAHVHIPCTEASPPEPTSPREPGSLAKNTLHLCAGTGEAGVFQVYDESVGKGILSSPSFPRPRYRLFGGRRPGKPWTALTNMAKSQVLRWRTKDMSFSVRIGLESGSATYYVMLGKLPVFLVALFPHLQNGYPSKNFVRLP